MPARAYPGRTSLEDDPEQVRERIGGEPGGERGIDLGSVVRVGIGQDQRL
jgi:hypothetical protein